MIDCRSFWKSDLITLFLPVGVIWQGKDVVGYLLFVYGAALIGSYACNKREREFRYTYLHRRILEDNKVRQRICDGTDSSST